MKGQKDKGFKLTPQRAAILEYLDGNTSHPSAEAIFAAISPRYPMMSLATVYNTLEALRGAGRVWELNIDEERRRYDPNTAPHHHLICERCRAIVDIHREFDLDVPEELSQGFRITGRHVEFHGICPKCLGEGI